MVGMSPYFAKIRAAVGSELLLIPGVTVLPWDQEGRLLLVRHDVDGPWGLIGGAIEPDEAPENAARREALEEVGVTVELTRLRGVFGGPSYRIQYDNGDEVSYVSTLFDAKIVNGEVTPDFDEVVEAGWFAVPELARLELNAFTHATFLDAGVLPLATT
jgi:8-oxo-dGTP pyrophosphatase MutT (NUDIX family)